MRRIFIYCTLGFIPGICHSQVDDIIQSYRNISGDKYFRLHYDNDYFTNADWYYTQGINLEVIHPGLKKFPLSRLLVKPKTFNTRFGISLNSLGYTPTSITDSEILYGDRSYAGTVYLKTFAIAADSVRKQRIATAFSLGLIGEGSGIAEMQKGIHRWLNNPQPKGWQNQVRNDAVIQYQVNYERAVLSYKNIFLVNAAGELRAGTLSDKLSASIQVMLGNFNDPYSENTTRRRFKYYIYTAPQISYVGYDATLQGGMFNKKSPYVIDAGDINRITYQATSGVVLDFRKIVVEYAQSYLSREFRTGLKYHRWGGIKIAVRL